MLPKALFAAALASSTASAVLLPSSFDAPPSTHHRHGPGKAVEAAGSDEASPDIASLVSPFYHELSKIDVPCPGCAMQVRTRGRKHRKAAAEESNANADAEADDGSKVITITNIANHIKLVFEIAHTPGQDRLRINDLELFPDVDGGALMAVQVPDGFDRPHHKEHKHDEQDKEDEEHEKEGELKAKVRRHRKGDTHGDHGLEAPKEGAVSSPPPPPGMALVKVPLGYSMQMSTVGKDSASGMDVVALKLQIIQVNNVFMEGIPAVNVRLIRTAEGGLMIARIDVGDQENNTDDVARLPSGHHRNGSGSGSGRDRMTALKEELSKCSNMVCRWKVMISSMRSHHGGCAGKTLGKGGRKGGVDVRPHHRLRPYHHHHHHHHAQSIAKKVVTIFLIPCLIGVVVGSLTFLIGTFAGMLVIRLWRMLYRERHHRSSAAPRHLDEQAVDEEKTGLMAEAEAESEAEAEAEDEPAAAVPLVATPPHAELPPYEDHDSKTGSA